MVARPVIVLERMVLIGERVIASIFMLSLVTTITFYLRQMTPAIKKKTGIDKYGIATQDTTKERAIIQKVQRHRLTVLGTIMSRILMSLANLFRMRPTGWALKKDTLARTRRDSIALCKFLLWVACINWWKRACRRVTKKNTNPKSNRIFL